MDPTLLPSPFVIKWNATPDKNSELKDTTILLLHYRLNELNPRLYKIGQGTPQGDSFSMRPRLAPVPRWIAPKPMSSFDIPQRQPSFYLGDPRKAKNFRTLSWMHTETTLLPKSCLNDTMHRALMPARPKILLRGSMFRAPRPQQLPSNSLRAFGTVLPGSTLQSHKVSVPLARDANGHIIDAPKPPKPGPVTIPIPPLGVTRKNVSYPYSEGARVMVHRMNLARKKWNTASIRTRRLSRYFELASEIVLPSTSETVGPVLGGLAHRIDGLCAYTKKMGTIEGSNARHKEASTLVELRNSLHKLLRSEQTPNAELVNLSSPEPNSWQEDPDAANTTDLVDSEDQQSYSPRAPEPNLDVTPLSTAQQTTEIGTSTVTSTAPSSHESTCVLPAATANSEHIMRVDLAPIIRSTWSIDGPRSPVSHGPRPRQKQPRAPASYPVPATRVLRSMNRARLDNICLPPVVTLDTAAPRAAVSTSVRRQPRKESKLKQALPINAILVPSAPESSTTSTSRYNLRPRKREFGKDEAPERGNKQTSRPVKRRRV